MRLKYGVNYESDASISNYSKAMAERYDMAERIMDGVRDVYSWAKKDILFDLAVRHLTRAVPIKKRMITDEEKRWCEENIEKMRDQIPSRADCTDDE